jgi:hypothetical protein
MLRNFTAALIATTLVAGSAFAAQPSATTTAAPAAAPTTSAPVASAPAASSTQNAAKPADTAKPVKTVSHVRKPVRHHTAHLVKPGAAKNVKSSA